MIVIFGTFIFCLVKTAVALTFLNQTQARRVLGVLVYVLNAMTANTKILKLAKNIESNNTRDNIVMEQFIYCDIVIIY